MRLQKPYRAVFCALAGVAVVGVIVRPGVAQDTPGVQQSFSLSETLRYNDNPDFSVEGSDSTFVSRTNLGYSLSARTSAQSFNFSTSGSLEFGDDTSDRTLVSPRVSLGYTRENRNTELTADVRIQVDELDEFTVIDDTTFGPTIVADDVVISDGQRIRSNAAFGFETGLAGPFGLNGSLSFSERDFRNIGASTAQSDRSEVALSLGTRFDISPRIQTSASVNLSESDTDDSDQTNRERESISLGADFVLRSDLTASFSLSRTNNTTTTTTSETSTNGFGLSFDLDYDRANGSIGLGFDTSVNSDGRRNSLVLTRALNLPNASFATSVGVTEFETGEIEPLINLSYEQPLPTGGLTIELSQSGGINSSDQSILNTGFSVDYSHSINTLSSISAGFDFARTNVIESSSDDTERSSFSVSYNRDLTKDWSMSSGFSRNMGTDGDEADRTANSIFLSIGRSFGR
ncbi:hypothetical protein [Roseobacter sp.]|uniref:hypothetical protein n=1 Tax=Roseobacter sp. TaxID=1907202 RepID=UPI00329750EA